MTSQLAPTNSTIAIIAIAAIKLIIAGQAAQVSGGWVRRATH